VTRTSRTHSRRRLDLASLFLLVIGVACGVISYWLVTSQGINVLVIIPSVVVTTFAALHITKREALRQ
jgi:hypothetical protein